MRLKLTTNQGDQMKKRLLCLIPLLLLLFVVAWKTVDNEYGVFIGASDSEISRIVKYQTVVIEPTAFSKENVEYLQAAGCTVYGYLNIGSLEEYRDYYSEFKDITLGDYEGWDEEKWIDVSNEAWQDYIVNTVAADYADLGLDGFFVDNADVYYEYPESQIYLGLVSILQGLRKYGLNVIINGGDVFVSECIDDNIATGLFYGVNQESVFTSVNFDDGTFGVQDEETTEYYKEYLHKASRAGLEVYVIEYDASGVNWVKAKSYFDKKGYYWYNSPDLNLD